MKAPSRILAAVDSSQPARSAFAYALALGQQRAAALTVLHAVPVDEPFRWRARERMSLIATLRLEADAAHVPFDASVQQGDPAGVILLHARSRRPDLIVIGTHQRTGLDRLKTGSIAERVARQATQPVLIVPVLDTHPVGEFRHIAVAIDLNGASSGVIEQARAVVGAGTRVTLVHVVPGASPGEKGSGHAGVPRFLYRHGAVEYQSALLRDASQRLQAMVPRTSAATAQIQGRVVTGDPATEIERVANEVEADLIVAGVTRRGVLARKVFGTTMGRIVRVAERPVLVVPSANRVHASRDRGQHPLAA